jgi:hypothetical protein
VVIVRPDHFLLDTVPAARLAEATGAYFDDVPFELRAAARS